MLDSICFLPNVKESLVALCVPEQLRESVKSDVIYLHYSTSAIELISYFVRLMCVCLLFLRAGLLRVY